MPSLTVAPASEHFTAWRHFIKECDETTFFHRPEWPRLIQAQFGYADHSLVALEGTEIVGLLPLSQTRSLSGERALISTAFTVGGGIAAHHDTARQALAKAAIERAQHCKAAYVELRSETAQLSNWVTKDSIYAGFRRPIIRDADARLKAIPRKKRADIRKGIKADPKIETNADLSVFFELYAQSLRNLGTPIHAKKWFQRLYEAFGTDIEISAVHGADGPVAALMSFYSKDQVLPYFGGASFAARKLHAYDYMYWKLMERAAERGVAYFDFGRSKFGTGAFDYKTHWGFEPQALAYQYHLSEGTPLPDINPTNPKYARFVKIWQKLPIPLANTFGAKVARYLP